MVLSQLRRIRTTAAGLESAIWGKATGQARSASPDFRTCGSSLNSGVPQSCARRHDAVATVVDSRLRGNDGDGTPSGDLWAGSSMVEHCPFKAH